jgi:hypothetical protein
MHRIQQPHRLRPAAIALLAAGAAAMAGPAAAATLYWSNEDVMTSGFFQGSDQVRGYAVDNRDMHRVSTPNPFGVPSAETIYLDFSGTDLSGFAGTPVLATLAMTSASGGFGADAGPGNPFTVSAHGVDADPLASIIDDTNPGGTVSFGDFYANHILPAGAAASTAVDGYGVYTWDVSALVNDWATGANPLQFIAMTGMNDTSGSDFLHGFLNDSENTGATYLEVSAVPLPGAVWLLGAAVLALAGLGRRGAGRRQAGG